jgi:hypothetical protein
MNHLIDKKGIADNKAMSLTKKLVYDYTKEKDFKGSFSDRVMFIRRNFSSFMNFLNTKLVKE